MNGAWLVLFSLALAFSNAHSIHHGHTRVGHRAHVKETVAETGSIVSLLHNLEVDLAAIERNALEDEAVYNRNPEGWTADVDENAPALEEEEIAILDYIPYKAHVTAATPGHLNIADLVNRNYDFVKTLDGLRCNMMSNCCTNTPDPAADALVARGEAALYAATVRLGHCPHHGPEFQDFLLKVNDYVAARDRWNQMAGPLNLHMGVRNPQSLWFRKPGISSDVYSVIATLATDLPPLFESLYMDNGCTVINLFDGRHGGKWGTYLDNAGTTAPLQEFGMIGDTKTAVNNGMQVIGSNDVAARGQNPEHVKYVVKLVAGVVELRLVLNLYDASEWSVNRLRQVKTHVTNQGHQQSCSVVGWCYSFATHVQQIAPDPQDQNLLGYVQYDLATIDAIVDQI